MDYVSKQTLYEELRKIKKKEQDLYKFILQQFLDLEEYKKSFSANISKNVDEIVKDKEDALDDNKLLSIKEIYVDMKRNEELDHVNFLSNKVI